MSTIRLLCVALILVAVAAAGYFAGTVVSRRRAEIETPINGAAAMTDLERRVSLVPGVTRAQEGGAGEKRLLFVVVAREDMSTEERKDFVGELMAVVEGELTRKEIVIIAREGGDVLRWNAEGSEGE